MTKQPIQPLSEDDIEYFVGADDGIILKSRLKALFAELKRRKNIVDPIFAYYSEEDVDELFAPLIEKEEK